jgi:DNA-binding CsgD family transcriptional regulator
MIFKVMRFPFSLNKSFILYGVLLGGLAVLLRLAEYKLVIINHTIQLYAGFVAVVFTVTGVAVGKRLARSHPEKTIKKEAVDTFLSDQAAIDHFGLTKREHEILQLIAAGLSNQEISEKIFLSIHTVKSHVSNLFAKLDVKRRTQAIQKAKEHQLI